MYKLSDVVYETGRHWVLRVETGYEIYRVDCGYSALCTHVCETGEKGLSLAKIEADKRELTCLDIV